MKHETFLSTSPSQTQKLGEKLAKKVLKSPLGEEAVVIGLEGDLGGGKTTFLKGFAKGLGIKSKILSPTFIILKKFQVSSFKFQWFYHIDCYRIEKPKEILALGFQDIISDPRNIVCLEWADKIKKILPKQTIILKFDFKDKNRRKITIEN